MTAEGPQGAAVREHARVPVGDVRAAIRIEETEDWLHVVVADLSMGGAFVLTEQYIVEGTRVDVGLQFPSGMQLFFLGEIARHVPAGPHGPSGMGIRLVDPPDAALSTLALELSPRMSPHAGESGPHAASTAVATQVSQPPQLLAMPTTPLPQQPARPRVVADELSITLYERLRLQPEADDATLRSHFDAFIASLDQQLAGAPAGSSQREQLAVFRKAMQRLEPLTRDPLKRVAYDFHNGFVRAQLRMDRAEAGTGPDLATLQKAWTRVRPKDVREAKRLLVSSRKAGDEAASVLAQALELDPFNEQILHEKQKFELKANLKAQLLGGDRSASGPTAPAPGPPASPPPAAQVAPIASPVVAPSSPTDPMMRSGDGPPTLEPQDALEAAEPALVSAEGEGDGWFGEEELSVDVAEPPSAPTSPPSSEGGGMFTTTSPPEPEPGGMFTTPASPPSPPTGPSRPTAPSSEGAGMFTTPSSPPPPAPDPSGFGSPVETMPVAATETQRMFTQPSSPPELAAEPAAPLDATAEPEATSLEAALVDAASVDAASVNVATVNAASVNAASASQPSAGSTDAADPAASEDAGMELVGDDDIEMMGDDDIEMIGADDDSALDVASADDHARPVEAEPAPGGPPGQDLAEEEPPVAIDDDLLGDIDPDLLGDIDPDLLGDIDPALLDDVDPEALAAMEAELLAEAEAEAAADAAAEAAVDAAARGLSPAADAEHELATKEAAWLESSPPPPPAAADPVSAPAPVVIPAPLDFGDDES